MSFFKVKTKIKVIGIHYCEKLYDPLFAKEKCAKVEEMGNFNRVLSDNRDLNYDKYFKDGDAKHVTIVEFNSLYYEVEFGGDEEGCELGVFTSGNEKGCVATHIPLN